jgi:predicted AAA+ superfamily ATPase
LENLVFLELLQRYDEVYTYTTSSNKEIDFLCIKNEQITYYQVTDYLFEKDEPNSN